MYADRVAYPLPDVIMTDLCMGADSGITLVEWVRGQTPPVRDTPMIILTKDQPDRLNSRPPNALAPSVYIASQRGLKTCES